MRTYLAKRFQVDTEELQFSSYSEHKKAKEILQQAKILNRPVKYLNKGDSADWQKMKNKINSKKY